LPTRAITRDHFGMAKKLPVDCRKLSAIHIAHLDDDQLGMLAQRIEIQTQQLNRAMRLVLEVMASRKRAEARAAAGTAVTG
jgi:hypothetical protein